jgi:hypothetical protein
LPEEPAPTEPGVGHREREEEKVLLFTESEYKSMREDYCYCDRDCQFHVVATTGLDDRFMGQFLGIFPKKVPPHYTHGIKEAGGGSA